MTVWLLVAFAVGVIAGWLVARLVPGVTNRVAPGPLPPPLERDSVRAECVLMDPLEQAVLSRRTVLAHKRPATFTRAHGRRLDVFTESRRDGDRWVYRLTRQNTRD